jgi:hypothetical protein
MSSRLEKALELRSAIFAAYAAIAEGACAVGTEYERRRSALSGIDEILDGQPLSSFSAAHLELLELMLAYWREAEVAGEIRPPSPDTIH